MNLNFPLIGTQYWRAPTPPESEWPGDLRAMADLGFDMIQLRVQWSWHERNEGEYDFAEVTRLMDLAHAAGLGVVVKVMLEDAPYWLYENYDVGRIAPDGRAIPPAPAGAFYAGLSLPCFDRPLVRDKADGFIRELVAATHRHPALLFFSLWNEIRSRPYGQCACPDSRRKFEAYLKARFDSVAEMNRALGKDFGQFSHFRPPAGLTDHTSPLIWRSWCRDTLADTLAWVKGVVREVAPAAQVVVHAGMCNVINNALGDATNDWLSADTVDMFGHSCVFWDGKFTSYQEIAGRATRDNPNWRDHQYILSMQDGWTRHVGRGRPTMNYEIYCNDYGSFKPDFTAREMDDFFLTSLAEGIRVLLMWQYRAERVGQETRNSGLVEIDGSATPRSEQTGHVARFIRANRKLLADYQPEPGQVAILHDAASDLMSALEDHSESGNTGTDIYRYKNNLKGWYRLFWDANIPADVIATEADDDLARYKLVVLPAMLIVSPAVERRVLDYLAGGGKVIVDAGFDSRGENGWGTQVSPRPAFASMLGGLIVRKHLIAPPGTTLDSPFGPLPVGQYVVQMTEAGGAWRSYQADRLMCFSFNPGEARFMHPKADFSPLYRWLAQWAGVSATHPQLRIRKGTSAGRTVWFVHNLGEQPAPLPLAGATDIFNGQSHIAPDQWAVLVR